MEDENDEVQSGDTLYFNAFTEDLFSWDNDLENDEHRTLKLNPAASFFVGLNELEIENVSARCWTATRTSTSGSTSRSTDGLATSPAPR